MIMPAAVPPVVDPDVERAQRYAETVLLLSEASVDKHFDPFTDIDWDNPDFAVDVGPERWILPVSVYALARHPWYRALSTEQKIEVGKYLQANSAKVSLQFESILISGMVVYNFGLPNGSPEFRYCSHEMIEEHNHILMFQEMVNRIGLDVPGLRPLFKALKYFAAFVAARFPNWFFMTVLAIEEPTDHAQKQILRSGDEIHPIMRGILAIHVAEEARHISFAREFLKNHVPQAGPVRKFHLSLAMPILMRRYGRAILTPPRSFFREFDVPKRVRKELFYGSPEAKQAFSDNFGDVRALTEEIGLMNPVAKAFWKALRIDGPASRYRSEPVRAANGAT
ncbi:AurF N-oxygenase family protein [Nocardia sp. 004]|uniref:AurF N-oxygenase family protein n=1 Tax=Nocardia sp. 004 TaxID=3385978 RepID=UPI0039A2C384